jgi:hypothetical protein
LDVAVKNMTIAYNKLAQKAVRLNKSYLDLLKVYDEINDLPGLLSALTEAGTSPLKVIAAMKRDRQTLLENFDQLALYVTQAKPQFPQEPEASELQAILHDRQVMADFINSINLPALEQMFSDLN